MGSASPPDSVAWAELHGPARWRKSARPGSSLGVSIKLHLSHVHVRTLRRFEAMAPTLSLTPGVKDRTAAAGGQKNLWLTVLGHVWTCFVCEESSFPSISEHISQPRH